MVRGAASFEENLKHKLELHRELETHEIDAPAKNDLSAQ
jgi:hypothetical protein